MNDTRFSSAIHMLVMVSESSEPLPSERIAQSIGTNATYVRKLAGSLRRAGIVESRRGASGFKLLRDPSKLTLLEIYQAVCESDTVEVFELHRNPNDECIVGRHIRPVLGDMFAGIFEATAQALGSRTLADCISSLGREIERAGDTAELEALGSSLARS